MMKGVLAAVVLLGFSLGPPVANTRADASHRYDQALGPIASSHTVSLDVRVRVTSLPGLLEGDATADGRVTVADAVAILQYSVGLRALDTYESKCADTNDDDRVSVADAVHILQFSVDPTGQHGVLTRPLWEHASDTDMLDPLGQ